MIDHDDAVDTFADDAHMGGFADACAVEENDVSRLHAFVSKVASRALHHEAALCGELVFEGGGVMGVVRVPAGAERPACVA